MNKYKNIWIILAVVAGLVLLASLGRFTNKPKMIFFYGDTCPHCHDVSNYIEANSIKDKLSFRELETYNHPGNARLLSAKAKLCKLDTSQGIPVPFFFDGANCYIGSDKIIEFFEEQTIGVAEIESDNIEVNEQN
jgi:glutaredoxin